MSYVTVFVAREDKLLRQYGTAPNNHGFAPLLWQDLVEKYALQTPAVKHACASYYSVIVDFQAVARLRAMVTRLSAMTRGGALTDDEKLLVEMTFDQTWCGAGDVPLLARALAGYPIGERAETMKLMAALIKQALGEGFVYGVAFRACSANENYWEVIDPVTEDSSLFDLAVPSKPCRRVGT